MCVCFAIYWPQNSIPSINIVWEVYFSVAHKRHALSTDKRHRSICHHHHHHGIIIVCKSEFVMCARTAVTRDENLVAEHKIIIFISFQTAAIKYFTPMLQCQTIEFTLFLIFIDDNCKENELNFISESASVTRGESDSSNAINFNCTVCDGWKEGRG